MLNPKAIKINIKNEKQARRFVKYCIEKELLYFDLDGVLHIREGIPITLSQNEEKQKKVTIFGDSKSLNEIWRFMRREGIHEGFGNELATFKHMSQIENMDEWEKIKFRERELHRKKKQHR